jgi:excisionase family DNA binding protein
MTLMIWETSVTSHGNNSAVIARKPVFTMTADKAAKVLGCDVQTIWRLYRNGVITGCKPGAGHTIRKDGRKSNAKLRLDSESVLKYKAAIQTQGVF